MSNSNLKGRATATFVVMSEVTNGVLSITVTADATTDDSAPFAQDVNGTVALGKAVAELGKSATPITASERRLSAQVEAYVDAGLSYEEAVELAEKINAI